MRNICRYVSTSMLLSAALLIGCVKPAPEPQATTSAPESSSAPAPKPLTPEEMQQKFMAYATPGKEHTRLNTLVGKWNAVTKMWMEPGKPPEVTKGKSTIQWIYGKRYLKQTFTGKFMGQTFQGEGLIGYDNAKKQYFSTWIDSMSTGTMVSFGNFSEASNSVDLSGTMSCPLRESDVVVRSVVKFVGKKEFVFLMYGPGPDGKEMQTMEITYKR